MMKHFKLFKRDETGVMTVEFAILLPIIFMWFAGLFMFFNAFHSWMKALKASYTVSDILTRQTVIDDAYLGSLDLLFDRISHSRDSDNTWMRVLAVTTDNAGDLEILWQHSTNNPTNDPLIPGLTEADLQGKIPIMASTDVLIFVQTHRAYTPLFTNLGIPSMDFVNEIASPLRFTAELVNEDHFVSSAPTDSGVDPEEPEDP